MPRRPQAPHQDGAEGPSRLSLSPWTPTDRLTLAVAYRGGAEAWYEVRTRGGVLRTPGWIALDDLMRDIYGGRVYPLPPPQR